MKSTNVRPRLIVFLTILIVASWIITACSSSATEEPTQAVAEATSTPEPTTGPEATATEAPAEPTATVFSLAVTNLRDVKNAVIQVESQGTFMDPEFGAQVNASGRGSGFIIDPSGLAVTNNHVVTGAALLKVWVGGDQSETYNAKVLGVSECSDLALIDIEGDGFPYLQFFEQPVDVGQEMYIAGFPLGDPEYSLNKGIISKAKADGESNWASVESVLEYDATSNPGNSGGPVVSPEGKVLAVHYAGNSSTRQAFGISSVLAAKVIDALKAGDVQDSVGLNGTAVVSDDGTFSGIWVSSVQSGSPADKAGVQPGDILTEMESLVLATDGTMADYCDILRSHDPNDTLSIQALRLSTGEILEGQINGRELETVSTFDTSTGDTTDTSTTTEGSALVDPSTVAPGEVFYSDDFDSDSGTWVYLFTSGDESGMTSAIADGVMSIELDKKDTWVYYIDTNYDIDNVRIDMSVENLGRNNNNVSLVCRYTDADGWYEFNIANNGLYWIYRYDKRSESYIELAKGGSNEINMGKGINEYTAVCTGNELILGINQIEARRITDNTLSNGLVGFGLSSFDVLPIIAEFDYFVLSVPE